MYRRAGSIVLDTNLTLDFHVLSFKVHDPVVRKTLGLNNKEIQWRLQCRNSPILDIKVLADKNVIGRTEVRITCNDQVVFPVGFGNKSRLREDFKQTWPFRGTAKGINVTHYVEMKLNTNSQEVWHPATVRAQRRDGFFEVLATKYDQYTGVYKQEMYPFVHKNDLRIASTHAPYEVLETTLVLMVPASDPLHATLSLDTGELVTQYFGRPSPSDKQRESGQVPEVKMKVSRDRSSVTGNIGHREFLRFWNVEARSVEVVPKYPGKITPMSYGSKSWKLRIGLCTHSIEIERKYKTKLLTLTVDDEVLVEASPEELGCQPGLWQVNFRFISTPTIDFEVYETDVNGNTLNSIGHVSQLKPSVSRVCTITVQDFQNLAISTLKVDGADFSALNVHVPPHPEDNINMTPSAMTTQYHITVPYKVNKEASTEPTSLTSVLNQFRYVQPSDFQGPDPRRRHPDDILAQWFPGFCCCGTDTTVPGSTIDSHGYSVTPSNDVVLHPPALDAADRT